jgi:hypothetical protein
MLASNLLRISVVIILVGMILGMVMGSQGDFRLAPAHAHLNLLGFVSLFLAGLYYQAVPQAAASALAKWQAVIAVIGAVAFPICIGLVLFYGPEFVTLTIATSIIAFIGMALFAIIVFRYGAPQRS